ncbi:hypothetical protein HPB50_001047 [Hyalomma asiaticum]|uniref:Uncharacterized protein n=1 Tax=Hyalomma asiaticum TaxID=266040 RepID=A0ACB7RLQ4_HYAAI|nr:hypothetical protein HPB50_001047 [Hyalomma asiaticum]
MTYYPDDKIKSTKAGLKILDEAGIAAPRVEISDGVQLTRDEQEDIQVDSIPRNIHPVHHAGRREARARAILRSVGSDAKAALFVDAAEYSTRRAFGVSVVDGKGQLVARASVCTDHVAVAEEIAIALALQAADVPCVVYSDSRSAVRAFSGGLVSQQAARLLRSGRRQARWAGGHHISWFPAHVEGIDGVNPNASAHTLARECTNRAGGGEASGGNIDLRKDPLTTFHEITTNCKLSRRRFPLPNARLNRAQGITFRLLQTDTYLCPLYMSDTCQTTVQKKHQRTFQLSSTGSHSTLTVRSQRDDFAPWWKIWERCTSTLTVTSPPGSRMTMSIEELDMYAEPKENYCVDFLDLALAARGQELLAVYESRNQGTTPSEVSEDAVRPLDSLVSRFCGSLHNTYPKTFASVGNKLRLKWNFYTASPDNKGFTVLLTTFTEPVGLNCTTAGSPPDAQFLCDNGRCIDNRWRCDERDNCGDASDEKACRDDRTLVILSICTCVAVVVVSGLLVTLVWMRFNKSASRRTTVVGAQTTAYSIPVGSDNLNSPPRYSHQPAVVGRAVPRSSGNRY